jgi:hypothetical protein
VLRQVERPLMDIGGATAPWVAIGFAIAVWATRRHLRRPNASAIGAVAAAAYLFAWLFAYHGLFAYRESVGLGAAWREAVPWLVLAGPASFVLGAIAARSHRRGVVGDLCLAAPFAWSLPELGNASSLGWPNGVVVMAVIAAAAAVPLVVAGTRNVRLGRIVVATVVLGAVAVALSPIVLSQVRS